jgi:lipoprotein-releasing system permease protein
VLHPITAFIALRYLATKRKNRFASFVSIVSILGIALGVAVLIIVSSVMNGFEKEVTRHIVGMTSHAMLFRPGARIDDWREFLRSIEAEPDVVAGAPFIRAGAMINHKGIVRGVSVQGVDINTERAVSTLTDAIQPAALAALSGEANNILLGQSLAETLEVEVGNTVTLVAPRWSPRTGIELPRYFPMKVIGTFKVGMNDFDAGFALLSLEAAARVFGLGDGVSGFRLRFTDLDAAPGRASEIAERLGTGIVAVNWTQYHRNFFHALKSQKRIMFVILSLIVAVAAFNIVATMVMVVKEKVRDIAILRTLGLRRRAVMLIFIIQGVLIGVAGVTVGVAVGAWGATKANRVVAAVERWFDIEFIKPDVYYIDYLPADVRLADITLIATVAFLICVIATLYPAWRAARSAPAVALRYE